jgi:hypothetical protein
VTVTPVISKRRLNALSAPCTGRASQNRDPLRDLGAEHRGRSQRTTGLTKCQLRRIAKQGHPLGVALDASDAMWRYGCRWRLWQRPSSRGQIGLVLAPRW